MVGEFLPPSLTPLPRPFVTWQRGHQHGCGEGTGLTGLAGRGLQEKRLQQHLQIGVAFWGGSHGKKGAAPCSDIPSAAALKCLQSEQHGGDTALPDPPRRWWRLGKIREPEHIAGT